MCLMNRWIDAHDLSAVSFAGCFGIQPGPFGTLGATNPRWFMLTSPPSNFRAARNGTFAQQTWGHEAPIPMASLFCAVFSWKSRARQFGIRRLTTLGFCMIPVDVFITQQKRGQRDQTALWLLFPSPFSFQSNTFAFGKLRPLFFSKVCLERHCTIPDIECLGYVFKGPCSRKTSWWKSCKQRVFRWTISRLLRVPGAARLNPRWYCCWWRTCCRLLNDFIHDYMIIYVDYI